MTGLRGLAFSTLNDCRERLLVAVAGRRRMEYAFMRGEVEGNPRSAQ
jgi:hypothetical protein